MIEQIKKDLQAAFSVHGKPFTLDSPDGAVEQTLMPRKTEKELFEFTALSDALVDLGSLIRAADGTQYIVIEFDPVEVLQTNACYHGVAKECNGSASIQRRKQAFDEYLNPIGEESWQEVYSGPAIVEHLRGGVAIKGSLLDDSEEVRVTMQDDEGVLIGDRAVLGTKAFKVDEIDRTTTQGLMVLRGSSDTR
jgi:hypothetical protein